MNIDNIRGLEGSIRHDTHELAVKLSMAIAMENEFIEKSKVVLGRFASVDKADECCRKAVYELSGTDNYYELQLMLTEHETKLRKLSELMGFVGGWECDFR